MHLLDNAFAFLFISFLAGVLIDPILRCLPIYGWLSTRFLFGNPKVYEYLGVQWFRWLLLSTPLRFFNPNIRFSKGRDLESLKSVQQHIASAEVSHWVGFAFMFAMTLIAWWNRGTNAGLSFLFFNVLGNLYPCMLQQYNKRRLYPLIAALEKRATAIRSTYV